ncbi:MAG: TfoX domain-containing protein [Parcubacteria group bacterium GW2011_GWA2_51_12]|nr:MAG: TfoX domain-containing protein [Parcubacteria group bacterium GW2011_GWA2_51_12]
MAQADKSLNEYVVHDLLVGIAGITSRAMFGGYGIYKNGKIFAIIADGELYFKVGDGNRADYEKYGSKPFVYEAQGKQMAMSYWQLPQEMMENKDQVELWVERSLAAQKETKKPKK